MKGPEYVGAVTAVYRRLLDERRAATAEETDYLAGIFSRSGFTDAYFCGRMGHDMLGTRTEADKKRTAAAPAGQVCRERTLPPVTVPERQHGEAEYSPKKPQGKPVRRRTAYMHGADQLTAAARKYFDLCFLPLGAVAEGKPIHRTDGCFIGAALPPVIFDSELPEVRRLLAAARERGINDLLVGNVGHLALAREFGMRAHGDFRLNICNRESAAAYEEMGFEDMILSPELTLPRMRDIGGRTLGIVYGRVPLMITEKCAGKECGGCRACREGGNFLTDRRGVRFPILREWQHRSLIVNSLPTSMSDKQKTLDEYGVRAWHFIFTAESPRETDAVLRAFTSGTSVGTCRRIAVK